MRRWSPRGHGGQGHGRLGLFAVLAWLTTWPALVAAQQGPAPPTAYPTPRVTEQSLHSGAARVEAETISIPLNKAHFVRLDTPVRDVIVANPEIADVVVKTPNDAYLIGKTLGLTNVFFVGRNAGVVRHILIEVESDINTARRSIEALLPEANIEVKAVGNSLVLTGTVRSARESVDAAAVARRFVDDDTRVINMLRVLKDLQVLLQVRVAEMQRTTIKNLSASTSFNRIIRDRQQSLTTNAIFPTGAQAAAAAAITFNKLGLQATTITALEQQGLVKTLAEPALTAISGETANFLAGGEIPTPSGIDSQGNLIIEFREFGVALSFTPVVLDRNQISLRISTEVSRQSEENKLILPFGTGDRTVDVLGLSIRRAESTVNLTSGGSLMIAGLLQNDEFNQVDGTPWLKDIPILGALFRSQAFTNNESELVVLVSAYVVRPVEPTTELGLPTDGFVPASDMDIYLFGRLYKQYGRSKGPIEEIPLIQGPMGYLME